MTIIVAQRRSNGFLIMGDSMIRDPNNAKSGGSIDRLKVVTLGHRVTIAFADSADPASVAIKEAHRAIRRGSLADALEITRQYSKNYAIEFVFASHHPDGEMLLRVKNGVDLNIDNMCALGDSDEFIDATLDRIRTQDRDLPIDNPGGMGTLQMAMMLGKGIPSSIGGFTFRVQATETDHHYENYGGFADWNFPDTSRGGNFVHPPEHEIVGGMSRLTVEVAPCDLPDVPVVGACLMQANLGLVFSPLERPEAFKVKLLPDGVASEGREAEAWGTLRQAVDEHMRAVIA